MELFMKQITPVQLKEALDNFDEDVLWSMVKNAEECDLFQTWHGIHYLLTGVANDDNSPLAAVVMGGEKLDNDQTASTIYLKPEEIEEIAEGLKKVSKEHLRERYNPKAMNEAEIYPQDWVDGDEDAFEDLIFYYDDLVKFYINAAEEGNGVVKFIG